MDKHIFKHVYSDATSGLDTDHFPLVAHITISLKAEYMIRTTRPKYIKCADQEQAQYNNLLADNYPITIDNDNITPWIKQAAEAHLPRKSFSSRNFELSEETERIIEQKRKAAKSGANDEELKPHQKKSPAPSEESDDNFKQHQLAKTWTLEITF